MRYLLSILAFAAARVVAGDADVSRLSYHERTINQASELIPWCKSEAESRYIAKNITPYQWSSSYHDKGNVLYVDGSLRVHGDNVAVHCRIARGSRESYATIEIDDPAL